MALMRNQAKNSARLIHIFKLKSENKTKHEQKYYINFKRGVGGTARGASVVKTLQIATTWLEQ